MARQHLLAVNQPAAVRIVACAQQAPSGQYGLPLGMVWVMECCFSSSASAASREGKPAWLRLEAQHTPNKFWNHLCWHLSHVHARQCVVELIQLVQKPVLFASSCPVPVPCGQHICAAAAHVLVIAILQVPLGIFGSSTQCLQLQPLLVIPIAAARNQCHATFTHTHALELAACPSGRCIIPVHNAQT